MCNLERGFAMKPNLLKEQGQVVLQSRGRRHAVLCAMGAMTPECHIRIHAKHFPKEESR